ncbi:MAG TPA: class I SAM-dependent methyltransferase [Solirubrobacteraceae bacterium]|jgi:SAM-dependent methyltransferase
MATGRPFYSEFGWAYDLLVANPVEPWVDAVEGALRARHAGPPARILDAGCGTGRHAAALAARGHELVLLEPVAELLRQARARLPSAPFVAGALGDPLPFAVDVAACRGVLNDLVTGEQRDAALRALCAALRPGGVLVLDVRDRDATAARYEGGRSLRREADGVTFTSEGAWDEAAGVVRIHERHEGRGRVAAHDLVMRPWTEAELREGLATAGFVDVTIAPGAGEQRSDRRLVVATRA